MATRVGSAAHVAKMVAGADGMSMRQPTREMTKLEARGPNEVRMGSSQLGVRTSLFGRHSPQWPFAGYDTHGTPKPAGKAAYRTQIDKDRRGTLPLFPADGKTQHHRIDFPETQQSIPDAARAVLGEGGRFQDSLQPTAYGQQPTDCTHLSQRCNGYMSFSKHRAQNPTDHAEQNHELKPNRRYDWHSAIQPTIHPTVQSATQFPTRSMGDS